MHLLGQSCVAVGKHEAAFPFISSGSTWVGAEGDVDNMNLSLRFFSVHGFSLFVFYLALLS